jgi:hypothetical protein
LEILRFSQQGRIAGDVGPLAQSCPQPHSQIEPIVPVQSFGREDLVAQTFGFHIISGKQGLVKAGAEGAEGAGRKTHRDWPSLY